MSERALTIPAGGKLASIMPTSFEDVQRFARVAVLAGLFSGGEEEKSMAQATLAIMQGLESGIPPVQAIQQIAIINGRATIWGDLVPALIWSRGHEIDEWIEGEGGDRVAHCKVTRGDSRKEIIRTFSVKQAIQAGLWDVREKVRRWNSQKKEWYEKQNDSPWFRFPDRMLQMRARGFAVRDGAPDVLRGMYIREEVEEEREVKDITPQAPEPPAPPMPPAPPEPPAIETQAAPEFNKDAFMAHVEARLSEAQDTDTLAENWVHLEGEMEEHLSRSEREEALAIYERHEARLSAETAEEKAYAAG